MFVLGNVIKPQGLEPLQFPTKFRAPSPAALRAGLTRYFDFYNTRRRHTALDRRTPDAVYFEQVAVNTAA